MDPQPRPQAQRFNPFIGAFFALAGIVAIATGTPFIGGAFLCVGAAFLVYWRDVRPWAEIPRVKRFVILGLIFLGAVFLVVALAGALGG